MRNANSKRRCSLIAHDQRHAGTTPHRSNYCDGVLPRNGPVAAISRQEKFPSGNVLNVPTRVYRVSGEKVALKGAVMIREAPAQSVELKPTTNTGTIKTHNAITIIARVGCLSLSCQAKVGIIG